MKFENRYIKSMVLMGVSEIILGVIFWATGFADWWFNYLHFFGYLGLGGILVAFWHYVLLRWDNRKSRRK